MNDAATSEHVRPKKRKRSRMTEKDCLKAFKAFAKRVQRQGETSDCGMFWTPDGNLPMNAINVQFAVRGGFGVADDLFEAIRVLAGYRLPAKGGPL